MKHKEWTLYGIKLNLLGGTVLESIKVSVYFGNLTPGIHFNTSIFFQLKSKIRPIYANFDHISSVCGTILTNLTEHSADNTLLTFKKHHLKSWNPIENWPFQPFRYIHPRQKVKVEQAWNHLESSLWYRNHDRKRN